MLQFVSLDGVKWYGKCCKTKKNSLQVKKNGEVYVSRPLDRELVSSYRLEVSVTDGVFVSNCKVTIEILDDNDSPPVCER